MTETVLIYTNNIIPPSETFIRNPPLSFERYHPHFVGSLRIDGLPMNESQVLVANGSGMVGRIRQRLTRQLIGDFGITRLAPRLKALAPKLLQAHYGHAAVHVLPLARRLNIPLITYYHGLSAMVSDEQFQQSPYMHIYLERREQLKGQTALFLAQSDYLKWRLVQQGFPEDKIQTHYIGIEVSDEAIVPLEQRGKYVLFVARLDRLKGARFLIEAMGAVQQRYPEIKLVLVGDGDARPRLEKQAQEQLQNYAFIGWQTPEEVEQWMKNALIFSMPSEDEGFGIVFLEAQNWGTPIVSARVGGIPEAVQEGETALLTEGSHVEQLTRHLFTLIENERLWQRMSHNGRAFVREHFNVATLAHQLETIYDGVIEEHKKATS